MTDESQAAVLLELEEWVGKLRAIDDERARVQEHIDASIRRCRAEGIEWKDIAPVDGRNLSYLSHRFSTR